jgi:hypothetical protein
MWLYTDYTPVTAFGLRPSNTTASGGKSLLCPTPYAVKMALIDRMIRDDGLERARGQFASVRDLALHVRVPDAVAVNRTFQKVQRPASKEEVWISTIAQREYCFHAGAMTLAIEAHDDALLHTLRLAFTGINYFGRRGGFFQWSGDSVSDRPPTAGEFVNLSVQQTAGALAIGFLQRMDDMEPDATFDDVSIWNPKGKGGRRSYTVLLPYELARHGAGHTIYTRRGGGI